MFVLPFSSGTVTSYRKLVTVPAQCDSIFSGFLNRKWLLKNL